MSEISESSSTVFIDMSTWAKKSPGAGHLFSLHSEIARAASGTFRQALIFGAQEEASDIILPIFRKGHFNQSIGTLFQKIGMNEELERANAALDQLQGDKLIHVYEGGLRELTFVSTLLSSRTDCSAVFNFFNTEPWLALVSKTNPFLPLTKRMLRQALQRMQPKVVFTSDTSKFSKKMADGLGLSLFPEYPLFSNLRVAQSADINWESRPIAFLFAPRTIMEKRLVLRTLKLLEQTIEDKLTVLIATRWKSSFRPDSLKKLKLKKLNVRVQSGPSSEENYSQLFLDSKVVVLPYLDKHYVYGSSGKLLDARAGACWVVAPKGTATGESIEMNGWGKTFSRGAADLAKTLAQIDLKSPPADRPVSPNAQVAVETVSKLAGFLPVEKAGVEQQISDLHWLPFLVGFKGLPWLTLHLLLVPGKRFLVGLGSLIRRVNSANRS